MKRKPRTSDKQQSRQFPGYGKLRCQMCGRPYTEHDRFQRCLEKPKRLESTDA